MENIIRSSKQLGEVLFNLRRVRKLSQIKLAEKTTLRQATISHLENGNAGIKLQTFFDVLAALDLELVVRERTKGSHKNIEDIF